VHPGLSEVIPFLPDLRCLRLLLACAVMTAGATMCGEAVAADYTRLEARAAEAREAWTIPGIAIAVVSTDSTLYALGSGVRDVAAPGRVDADTRFLVGSVSKSLSAAVIGTYVDQGRLRWDDRVVDHLPWFRLSDPWVGAETRIEDVLSHRVGVEATDWMDDVPGLSWRESVSRLRHLPQARPFRTGLLYDNFMYSVGGQIVNEIDHDYADAARSRLFAATGMTRTLADFERVIDPRGVAACNECEIVGAGLSPARAARKVDNVSLPHVIAGDVAVASAWRHQSSVSAGSTLSSVNDLGRYLRLLLGRGQIDGKRVLSERTVDELLRPRIFDVDRPPAPSTDDVAGQRSARWGEAYALGLFVGEYAGEKVIHHSGGMLGAAAQIALLPERGIGVVVLANQRNLDGNATTALLYEALDLALGLPTVDWIARLRPSGAGEDTDAKAATGEGEGGRTSTTDSGAARLADASVVGDFCHPAYGVVHVRTSADGLRLDQGPERVGALGRDGAGGFVLRWNGPRNAPQPIDFDMSSSGAPLAIRFGDVRFPVCPAVSAGVPESSRW
jgi:CubicO group peptidase (beta-lactamase class C family)